MDSEKQNKMIDLLDDHHTWPDTFVFKFIYKSDPATDKRLKGLFPDDSECTVKSSKKKNYSSMSVSHRASSGSEVMEIYKEASKIEGVISL